MLKWEALKKNIESYADMLVARSSDNLFSKGFVEKLGAFILKLHRKRVEFIKRMTNQYVP